MNSRDSVKVHVAAFGKHPGWDDHIEEIGLDSALLVNAKRVLYTECIGGNIYSGVWEKLEPEKQLPFGHTFFWARGATCWWGPVEQPRRQGADQVPDDRAQCRGRAPRLGHSQILPCLA
jgi:hypothetical protein